MQEGRFSSSAFFITLTYDTRHVPLSKNNFMTLDKGHIQAFMKRLRKAHSPEDTGNRSLKYYLAGEYGGDTMRPHYHMILFNAKIEKINDAWKMGHIHYGDVTGASIGYTLKYMCKPSKIPLHRNDDRLPEFSLMSKGLGEKYITPAMMKWHKADLTNRMYCNIEDGKKIAMPRYYKNKIYHETEQWAIAFFAKIKNEEMILQEMEKLGCSYYDEEKQMYVSPYYQAQHKKVSDSFEIAAVKSKQNRNKI